MSARSYERLSIEDFGAQLLETGDLDPIYLALHKMQLTHDQLCRWLLAYWCLYHAGAASYLSDQTDERFWVLMHAAAENQGTALNAPVEGGRWPRGAERRHWRGGQAKLSIAELHKRLTGNIPTQALVADLYHNDEDPGFSGIAFSKVRDRVLAWRGFGPWIAFKIGDMIDRLGLAKVSFEQSEVFMFQTPREAAIELAKQKMQLPPSARLKDEEWAISEVVTYLTNHFNGYLAPPLEDRVVGLQEVETILCKWKSHMSGHYPLGKDTREITEGLYPWIGVSPTARNMRREMLSLGGGV